MYQRQLDAIMPDLDRNRRGSIPGTSCPSREKGSMNATGSCHLLQCQVCSIMIGGHGVAGRGMWAGWAAAEGCSACLGKTDM